MPDAHGALTQRLRQVCAIAPSFTRGVQTLHRARAEVTGGPGALPDEDDARRDLTRILADPIAAEEPGALLRPPPEAPVVVWSHQDENEFQHFRKTVHFTSAAPTPRVLMSKYLCWARRFHVKPGHSPKKVVAFDVEASPVPTRRRRLAMVRKRNRFAERLALTEEEVETGIDALAGDILDRHETMTAACLEARKEYLGAVVELQDRRRVRAERRSEAERRRLSFGRKVARTTRKLRVLAEKGRALPRDGAAADAALAALGRNPLAEFDRFAQAGELSLETTSRASAAYARETRRMGGGVRRRGERRVRLARRAACAIQLQRVFRAFVGRRYAAAVALLSDERFVGPLFARCCRAKGTFVRLAIDLGLITEDDVGRRFDLAEAIGVPHEQLSDPAWFRAWLRSHALAANGRGVMRMIGVIRVGRAIVLHHGSSSSEPLLSRAGSRAGSLAGSRAGSPAGSRAGSVSPSSVSVAAAVQHDDKEEEEEDDDDDDIDRQLVMRRVAAAEATRFYNIGREARLREEAAAEVQAAKDAARAARKAETARALAALKRSPPVESVELVESVESVEEPAPVESVQEPVVVPVLRMPEAAQDGPGAPKAPKSPEPEAQPEPHPEPHPVSRAILGRPVPLRRASLAARPTQQQQDDGDLSARRSTVHRTPSRGGTRPHSARRMHPSESAPALAPSARRGTPRRGTPRRSTPRRRRPSSARRARPRRRGEPEMRPMAEWTPQERAEFEAKNAIARGRFSRQQLLAHRATSSARQRRFRMQGALATMAEEAPRHAQNIELNERAAEAAHPFTDTSPARQHQKQFAKDLLERKMQSAVDFSEELGVVEKLQRLLG